MAHRLFTQWDSGVRVLGGVAAFRPYDDSETGRRQSDVVLVVPDGVIVARLVGSQRQNGPIVTHPTGAWTIGGEVMRIVGGGSNPLSGLREAQEAVAATLRASGLEPGRVAMLVAVGSGEPVQPADGQLADGIIACPLSEEGLAIGVRRAAALTAAADVRQWTTADVKAALSAIRAPGRVPAVEELNAEGFMYSPYILRRPDLVAAASAVAAAAAESTMANSAAVEASSTADADDGGPPTQAARVVDDDPAADVGLSGLLSSAAAEVPPPPAMPPVSLEPQRPVPGYADYDEDVYPDQTHVDEPARRRRVLRVLAVLVALVLIGTAVYVGVQMFVADPDGGGTQASDTSASEQAPTSETSSTQQISDNTYTLALSRDGDTCAGNANGQVGDYFDTTDCTSLARELYTTQVNGIDVLVSVARVTMPDAATAADFKALVDSDGTGNVDDLFESGESLPEGGPTELVPAAYASDLNGQVVIIVVTGWADPAASGAVADLEDLASEALGLQPPA
ncbi:MAG: hypothetical protein ABIZ34_08370 [Candidatus Limnocylindrales bacterium]